MNQRRRSVRVGTAILGAFFFVMNLVRVETAQAQRSDVQVWSLVTATATLDEQKKWFLYTEVQPRLGDDVKDRKTNRFFVSS